MSLPLGAGLHAALVFTVWDLCSYFGSNRHDAPLPLHFVELSPLCLQVAMSHRHDASCIDSCAPAPMPGLGGMMLADDGLGVLRVVGVGVLTYIGMVVLLRLSGNRTLSKMNSFDLVVTVAFGSALASVLIDKKIPLTVGLGAIAVLIMLQFIVTWLSVRSPGFNRLVKTQPTLLVHEGQMRKDAMRRVRVTEDEILGALRKHGIGDMRKAGAVVMESDGSLSVIMRSRLGDKGVLHHVDGYH